MIDHYLVLLTMFKPSQSLVVDEHQSLSFHCQHSQLLSTIIIINYDPQLIMIAHRLTIQSDQV